MHDIIAPPSAQFLRSDAIRGGMDLLMFAHRSHLAHADEALAERGLGRAHHRVLYLLARNPGGTVTNLLGALGVAKQSLNRVMNDLRREELVETRVGERDRRTKLLFLTSKGVELEGSLFNELHNNMARAYAAAGEDAVRGYWTMLQHLMDSATHQRFLAFNATA
ncbi:MAG: MarR family transcriptional regulator [Oxalobacteraceae bacterium]|nr:MAG: MarR family transcriptional regulator [Oxalobacteraceae bacterium]